MAKAQKMRVLVACEESQRVCTAFRELGHEAYSCDILPCSGGHPEWHIQGDALALIDGFARPLDLFFTEDGMAHNIPTEWDLIIAHPPCTYLTSAGAVRLFNADHQVKDAERERKMLEASRVFLRFFAARCPRVAVENPAPMHYCQLPKYDQIIEPYQFGDPWKKRTCLWLRGLPPLTPTDLVKPAGCWTVSGGGSSCRIRLKGPKGAKNARERAKTFPGIAKAMAEQWGGDAREEKEHEEANL